jgi:predicted GIY-YIG superfamily endonuclease
MATKRVPRGYWNNIENIKSEALKYETRAEFKRNANGAYESARLNNWLLYVTEHMKTCGTLYLRFIYVFEFEDNSIYVGLTFDTKERYYNHINSKSSPVFKHIEKTNSKFVFKIITENPIPNEEAQKLENETIENYRNNGWNILNKAKTGLGSSSLGSNNRVWTEEKCREAALKYEFKKDFRKFSPKECSAAQQNGWLESITNHMTELKKPPGYWDNLEHCRLEASKYSSRVDFQKYCSKGYESARINNWLDIIIPVKEREKHIKWTKEVCSELAAKFTSKSEFRSNYPGAYQAASKIKGFINEITNHMTESNKPVGYWDIKENCLNEARKYKSRKEFNEKSQHAYEKSRLNGWLDSICEGMEYKCKPPGYWNDKEKCHKIALQFIYKPDFIKEYGGLVNFAKKMGWFSEITSHMIPKPRKNAKTSPN